MPSMEKMGARPRLAVTVPPLPLKTRVRLMPLPLSPYWMILLPVILNPAIIPISPLPPFTVLPNFNLWGSTAEAVTPLLTRGPILTPFIPTVDLPTLNRGQPQSVSVPNRARPPLLVLPPILPWLSYHQRPSRGSPPSFPTPSHTFFRWSSLDSNASPFSPLISILVSPRNSCAPKRPSTSWPVIRLTLNSINRVAWSDFASASCLKPNLLMSLTQEDLTRSR